jgi:hypothetical protein
MPPSAAPEHSKIGGKSEIEIEFGGETETGKQKSKLTAEGKGNCARAFQCDCLFGKTGQG